MRRIDSRNGSRGGQKSVGRQKRRRLTEEIAGDILSRLDDSGGCIDMDDVVDLSSATLLDSCRGVISPSRTNANANSTKATVAAFKCVAGRIDDPAGVGEELDAR